MKIVNADQNAGIDIVRKALEAPADRLENAGVEGSIVIGKLSEQKDVSFGFDAQTESYTDLVKAGIIDPVKVVRTLENASSIAGLLLTTEAMVAELPEPKEPMPPMPAGGMGGMVNGRMGGMDFKSFPTIEHSNNCII